MCDTEGPHVQNRLFKAPHCVQLCDYGLAWRYGGPRMIRRHIVFRGWVQGVGFRYRAEYAAQLYGCTGWVRNEWDGSVLMEIQGEAEAIDKVIVAIERGTYVRIENMDSQTVPTDPEEFGFWTE